MYNEYELHGMTDEKIRTAHFNQVVSLVRFPISGNLTRFTASSNNLCQCDQQLLTFEPVVNLLITSDNTTIWLQVEQRMATEEATCQLQNAEHSENK